MAAFGSGSGSGVASDEALARAIALSLNGGGSGAGRKRPRGVEDAAAAPWSWMAPGYAGTTTVPAVTLRHRRLAPMVVEHGSSLSLIARGTSLLNEEFSNVDVAKDFEKWRKIGARPYFFAVVDPHTKQLHSVLRCLLDGDFESCRAGKDFAPRCSHRRIVIEYLSTPKPYQGRGHASRLLQLVKGAAASFNNCNVFVSSLEESCPYWMEKGFLLEQGEINKRLNSFPDTHLLKLASNKVDVFPMLSSSSEEDDEDDEDDDEEDEDEDAVMQQVLMQSLLHSRGESAGDDDDAFRIALAMSVASDQASDAVVDLSN